MDSIDRPVPDLSVVIPAYNESERLPKTLTEALGVLAPSGRAFEILVVDDGSKDATAEEIRRFGLIDERVRLVKLARNRGKGYAVRAGVFEAIGRRVMFIDADGATPFGELTKLEAALDDGADVAIGTRAAGSDKQHVKALWYRKLLGGVFNFLVRLLVVKGFSDTQCGFKLFKREAAAQIFGSLRQTGFAFDVEVLMLAGSFGWKVAEVPVDWVEQKGGKINLLVDSLRMLGALFAIRWAAVLRRYDRGAPARDHSPEHARAIAEPAAEAPKQRVQSR